MRVAFVLIACLALRCASAADDLVFASFADGKGPAIDHDEAQVALTVGPRSQTERDPVLKFTVKSGEYPGIAFSAPRGIPKDWSGYEALSFTVWSPVDGGIGVRIDDERSTNYATRFNGEGRYTKGRTRVQIPIAQIARAIDAHRVKQLVLFYGSPPAGLTVWFDDFRLGKLAADTVDFIPYDQRLDHQPSMEVVTPHLPFARGLAGGPLPAFVLGGVAHGRETVELMQRIDLKPSVLSWDREWGCNTWGFGDAYGARGHDVDCALMQRYLASSMQGPEQFSVMAMSTPMGWNRFGLAARKAILERVRDRGEGLVLVLPFPGDQGAAWPDDLKELSALVDSDSDWVMPGGDVHRANSGYLAGEAWEAIGDHPITRGVPLEALPQKAMAVQQYAVAPGAQVLIKTASGAPVVAVRQVGKGRVVTIAARARSLTPDMPMATSWAERPAYRYWEAWYDLMARAMAWAGGRDLARAGEPSVLKPTAHADPWFTVRQWKDKAGAVTDWELAFADPDPGLVDVALTAPETVAAGARIDATFTAPPEVRDAAWTAELGELGDGRWRTLDAATVDPAKGVVSFPSARVRQYTALVRLRARRGDKIVAEGRADVVVTPASTWDDYETLTWLEGGLPFLVDDEMARMRAFGLTGNTVGPWDKTWWRTLLRGGMRLHACGFASGLHMDSFDQQATAWRDTHDHAHLVRKPSFADAAFANEQRRKTSEMAKAIAPYAPLSFITGDETSLTSYTAELDLDEHPANVAAFRAALAKRFGDVAALNAAFGSAYASFDAVQPVTGDEAKTDAAKLAVWNAWRAHNDAMWAGVFGLYRDAVQAGCPGGRLSVSGTQEQAPFNGIDWALLTPQLGAVCGYGGRWQELQRVCYRTGELRATPWCAYGRSGPSVEHQVWSNLLAGGSGMAMFWWYSLRDYDLTFCRSGRDYQAAIATLSAGLGKQYLHATRAFAPVAILWSADSQRASWVAGRFEEFKKAEAEVMNALNAAGFDASFISEQQVADGELAKRGVRAVVLPMTVSLGRGAKKGGLATLPALAKLIADGGVVIATEPATKDEFLREAPAPAGFVAWNEAKADLVATLAKAKAAPWAPLTNVHRAVAVVHDIQGAKGAHLLTLLREPVGTHEVVGADGVPYAEKDESSGAEVETARIAVAAFGASRFTDCRTGVELPVKDGAIEVAIHGGEGRPIAVLPYAVTALAVETTIADRALTIAWKLTSDAKALATHVARVEVLDAKGQPISYLCSNQLTKPDGTGSLTLPLATEDQPTTWRVRVRDVLTGKTAEAAVK